ncbi:MAG: hypothetical protein F6K16_39285 [Symploca sp. SIO2B6]|nr:hypothetical protein [Symploca sp. SIO2B6]
MFQTMQKALIASALSVPVGLSLTSTALAAKDNFEVRNNTGVVLEYLYMSESSLPEWGDDTLGANQVINPGGSVRMDFANPSPQVCFYDILAIFADGDRVEAKQVDVCDYDYYQFYDEVR